MIPAVALILAIFMYFAGNVFVHDYMQLILLCLGILIYTFGMVDHTVERDKKLSDEELAKLHEKAAKEAGDFEGQRFVISMIFVACVIITLIVLKVFHVV